MVIPLIALINSFNGGLIGLKKSTQGLIGDKVVRPFTLIILILLFSLVEPKLTLSHVALFTVFSYIIVLFLSLFFIGGFRKFPKPKLSNFSNHTKISFIFLMSGSMYILLKQVDIFLVGELTNSYDAGLYKVATRLSTLPLLGLMAVNVVVAPYFAKYYKEKNFDNLQDILNKSTKIIFLISAMLTLLTLIFKDYVLGLFGEAYLNSGNALLVLIFGQFINACTGSVGYILNMTNYHTITTKVLLVGNVLNFTLNLIFINLFGFIGAAYATALSTVFTNVMLAYYCWSKLGLKAFINFR